MHVWSEPKDASYTMSI